MKDFLGWSSNKENLSQFQLKIDADFLTVDSYAMLNQVRSVSKKRLIKKLGRLSELKFVILQDAIQKILIQK